MSMKKILSVLCLCLLMGCTRQNSTPSSTTSTTSKEAKKVTTVSFGILTGMSFTKETVLTKHYQRLIINPQGVSQKTLEMLHEYADEIYAFVNVGTMSKRAKSYQTYKSCTAGYYNEEKTVYIMNVTKKKWRQHVVNDMVKPLIKKGFDGVCLDHFDIYETKDSDTYYSGLRKILTSLNKSNIPVLLHQASAFTNTYCAKLDEEAAKEAEKSKTATESSQEESSEETPEEEPLPLISGVVQQQVFTRFDEEKNETKKQDTITSNKLKTALNRCYEHGINVYIVEYTKNTDWRAVIKAYCKSHKFTYYMASSLSLDQE